MSSIIENIKRLNKSKLNALFSIPVAFFVIFFAMRRHSDGVSKSRKELRSLNLQLSGVVVKIIKTYNHDQGLIFLENIKTNMPEYDLRGKGQHYYAVIKGDKAVIIQVIYETKVGDYLMVNTYTENLWVFRNGKLIFRIRPMLNTDNDFVRGLENKINF